MYHLQTAGCAVNSDWFKWFVCSDMGGVQNYHIAESSKNLKRIYQFGLDVRLTEVKSEEYFEKCDLVRSCSADGSLNKHA